MRNLFAFLGNILALVGIMTCLVAGVTRIFGNSYLFDFEAGAFFNVGIALMVMACLLKLQQLTDRK